MESHINIDVDKVDSALLLDSWHQVRDASVACPLTAVLAFDPDADLSRAGGDHHG